VEATKKYTPTEGYLPASAFFFARFLFVVLAKRKRPGQQHF